MDNNEELEARIAEELWRRSSPECQAQEIIEEAQIDQMLADMKKE